MTASRLWTVPLAALIVAPLVTWLPMLSVRWPGIPLPAYHPIAGVDLWPAQTFWAMAFGLLAVLIRRDRWLAATVALAGLMVFWRGARLDPTHAVLFALGALALWSMRQTPHVQTARVLAVVTTLGAFEAGYILQQKYLHYDLLWGPVFGGVLNPVIQPLGTLGTVDAASAFVAITAPLAPLWLLPLFVPAVWCSQSAGAIGALVLGLGLRFVLASRTPATAHGTLRAVAIRRRLLCWAVGLVPLLWYYFTFVKVPAALWPRLAIWGYGLNDAVRLDPVLGYGLGGWAQRIPSLQVAQKWSPTGELFREAHSEYVQWACELGVVGLILLAGWLWTHRTMFAHPQLGGALSALAVSAGSFFTFHVVATALLGIVLVGLATADELAPHPALGGS